MLRQPHARGQGSIVPTPQVQRRGPFQPGKKNSLSFPGAITGPVTRAGGPKQHLKLKLISGAGPVLCPKITSDRTPQNKSRVFWRSLSFTPFGFTSDAFHKCCSLSWSRLLRASSVRTSRGVTALCSARQRVRARPSGPRVTRLTPLSTFRCRCSKCQLSRSTTDHGLELGRSTSRAGWSALTACTLKAWASWSLLA